MSVRLSSAGQGPLLHAFCHRCERWRVLDAGAFAAVDDANEQDAPPVSRCPDCGEYGLVKVRLPPSQPRETGLVTLAELLPDCRYLL